MARYIRILRVSLVFLSLTALGAIARAQDAQIQGQVLDPSGAGVSKGLVRVVDQRIGTEARAETNDEGGYTVPALNAGLYKVFVQAAGFSTAASDPITLAASQNAVLNFTLQVSANATNVVVTSEKREENLLDVPVPVTALDGDTLSENNHVLLQDYFTKVPGLNVAQNIVGTQNLSIRGVTTGGLTTPVVGIVIDDVPFGASSGSHGDAVADIDPGDLARIEVLRGPQGTLYGADSMGGLVKFVTVDPSTEGYSGRVEVGTSGVYNGDKPGYKLRGSFNVPLSHTLAVRASGFTRQDPGYIDNPILRFRGVNEAEGHGGRVSALWRPTDTVSLKVSALFQDNKTNGLNEVDIQPGLTGLQQNYIPGVGGDRATVQAYSGVLKAKLGSFDVTSLTGYNVLHVLDSVDFGFAFSPAVQKSFGVSGAPYFSGDAVRKFTQELRASVPIGRKLQWLVGSFYTHESDASYFDVFGQNISTGQIVGTYWDFRQSHEPDKFEEYAAFTNLTYHVTDRLDFQVGGRESHLKVALGELIQSGPFIGSTPSLGPSEGTSANSFTYQATPRFRISKSLMAYARFASGYRPGTPNLPVPSQPRESKPDQTKTYEVGAKGYFLNQKFSLDASLFYIAWSNIQIQLTDSSASHLIYNTNGSGAKSEGTELTLTARPRTGLEITAWADYDNAVLTRGFPASSPTFGIPGDRLPLSSRYSSNISVEKNFPIRNDALGFIGGEVSYVGDRIGVFGTTSQRQYFPAYTKIDLRAGVRHNSWSVSLYANNVSDSRALINGGIGYFYPPARIYITPRTVGLFLVRTF